MVYRILRWAVTLRLVVWICTPNILALHTVSKPTINTEQASRISDKWWFCVPCAVDTLNQVSANVYCYKTTTQKWKSECTMNATPSYLNFQCSIAFWKKLHFFIFLQSFVCTQLRYQVFLSNTKNQAIISFQVTILI